LAVRKIIANILIKSYLMVHNEEKSAMATEILIFKTSIQTPLEVRFLSTVLDKHNGISSWSVDLDDWEKILRIESTGITNGEVISLLTGLNIRCKHI